ncbi:SPOR domain-containing protein [Thalassospira sp. SM2505]
MARPPCDRNQHAAPALHGVCASWNRGGLLLLVGFLAFGAISTASTPLAIAQTPGNPTMPTGVDMIPTDLPAHASEPVNRNRPLSLLPGTIPVDNSIEDDAEIPSLANQYYQTLTGTAQARQNRTTPAATVNRTKVISTQTTQTGTSAPAPTGATEKQAPMVAIRTETASRSPNIAGNDTSGIYLIQLGAFHDTISAESYWASFLVRYPDLSRAHTKQIVTADLGTKGIYHRLQLTGFASYEGAKQQCRQLKADGTDCFATHR